MYVCEPVCVPTCMYGGITDGSWPQLLNFCQAFYLLLIGRRVAYHPRKLHRQRAVYPHKGDIWLHSRLILLKLRFQEGGCVVPGARVPHPHVSRRVSGKEGHMWFQRGANGRAAVQSLWEPESASGGRLGR